MPSLSHSLDVSKTLNDRHLDFDNYQLRPQGGEYQG
jgi:hypothetical protein